MFRLAPILFLVLITGCSRQSPWVYQGVSTHQGGSVRLSHPPENTFRGLELEFLKVEEKTYAFLNIYQRTLSTTEVVVETDKGQFTYTGALREGGQRILLPEEAKETLLEALLEGKNVTLSTAGYTSTISTRTFGKLSKKLL